MVWIHFSTNFISGSVTLDVSHLKSIDDILRAPEFCYETIEWHEDLILENLHIDFIIFSNYIKEHFQNKIKFENCVVKYPTYDKRISYKNCICGC